MKCINKDCNNEVTSIIPKKEGMYIKFEFKYCDECRNSY